MLAQERERLAAQGVHRAHMRRHAAGQLRSPKKLLALQRQTSISNAQQRQVCGTYIEKSISPTLEDSNQISSKGFGSESSSTSKKNRDNEDFNVVAASNASYVDSNQFRDENCHREGHRNNSFSGASVGNY